ncbi:hypothetical protein OSTOST_04461 [Ostertagia ostertagi]
MCPFVDPYWAFYWPGGQAVTRYILDNSQLFLGANVLDFGCGCGSASIAASKAGATVIANDIDSSEVYFPLEECAMHSLLTSIEELDESRSRG